jgi:peroxiredoxin
LRAYRDQYASLFRDGQDIVLLAVSTDSPREQYEWARDEQFPFLFASDPDGAVAQRYGTGRARNGGGRITSRTVYIIDERGRIAWRVAPFREIDPTAYEELAEVLSRIVPETEGDE